MKTKKTREEETGGKAEKMLGGKQKEKHEKKLEEKLEEKLKKYWGKAEKSRKRSGMSN